MSGNILKLSKRRLSPPAWDSDFTPSTAVRDRIPDGIHSGSAATSMLTAVFRVTEHADQSTSTTEACVIVTRIAWHDTSAYGTISGYNL